MSNSRRNVLVRRALFIGALLLIAGAAAMWSVRESSDDVSRSSISFSALSDISSQKLRADYDHAAQLYESKEYDNARRLLLPLARAGLVEARYLVGRMYALGDGVEKNLSEAERWIGGVVGYYRLAAAKGDLTAQYQLGAIYLDTVGLQRDEAYGWTAKAALRGHSGAQFNLSKFFSSAKGKHLPEEAVYWLRTAAEAGNVQAQYDLGFRLAGGKGIDKNPEHARQWLSKAAAQGHPDAQKALQAFGLSAMRK